MEERPPQSFFDQLQASVKMRPRWIFLLEHASIVAAIIFVAVGLVYFGSFITYLWRSSQFSSLPSFGSEGYRVFFRFFPWWYIVPIMFGAIALVYIVRRYTKVYRWPLVVTLGVFLLAFFSAAILADSTHFHDRLTNRAIAGKPIPFVGGVYRGQAPITQGIITAATIIQVNGKTLIVMSANETLKVKITEDTRLPDNWSATVNDEIVVIGKRDTDEITAHAIHRSGELPNRRPFRLMRDRPEFPAGVGY